MDHTHFRCAFDVSPAGDAALVFPELVNQISGWIRSKERGIRLSPDWLLKSGRTDDGRSMVAVDSMVQSEQHERPDIWALRYEHQDSEFPARRWRIDFGLGATSPDAWRLSVTVSNSLHQSYIGKEPGALPVTPPRIVKSIVSSTGWRCHAGDEVLSVAPNVVRVGQGHTFVQALLGANRACPIVYVSRSRKTGAPLVDPERLAMNVVGAGTVYVAESPEIDDELEYLIPKEFRAPNGMVRVYAPGAKFDDLAQAYRHRFFTRQQVETQTPEEVEGQIARGLTRRLGWAAVRSSVCSIDDVDARRRELRRAQLQQQIDPASRDELSKLFEEENEVLKEDLRLLAAANDEAQQRVDERDAQVEELRDQLRTAEYQQRHFQSQADDAQRKLKGATVAADAVRNMVRLPRTLPEVIDLIALTHGTTVVFTPEARESARKAELNDIGAAWEVLWAAAVVLPRLVFDEDIAAFDRAFHSETGFELAMTEGRQTKKSALLVALRKLTFEEREWDMSAHIKYGNKPPKLLRVHFALDRDARRVIVGHCGDHLDTAGTAKRR